MGNLHSYIIIVTNHAGSDLYRFSTHGWLNYQIEHHMWPNLSMLSYQKALPLVKEICKRHGVPYIQESVFVRLVKTVGISIGLDSMRQFPVEYEARGNSNTGG